MGISQPSNTLLSQKGLSLVEEGGSCMTEAQPSDALKKLVIIIIGMAILGTIIALAMYFAVELPIQQAALHAPANVGIQGFG